MKTLNIQVDDSLYPALLEILKNLPASKIQIQEQGPGSGSGKELSFEQAMDYTLDKNKELYKRLS